MTLLDLPPRLGSLSPREREVVDLLAEGLSNKDIATNLGIRIFTVKNHITASLKKLGIDQAVKGSTRVMLARAYWYGEDREERLGKLDAALDRIIAMSQERIGD